MEDKTKKRILISCGVILVIACLCIAVIVVSGVGVSFIWPLQSSQEGLPTPLDDPQAPTASVSENSSEPSSELPEELARTLDQIELQVLELRGLRLVSPVKKTLISLQELEDIVVNDFFSEYSDEEAREDVLILSLLGLLPEGFSLKSFYQDLYSEQIAGFYDDETEEIFVVQGSTFGGNEKLTYAHEFTHVLQDQAYDLSEGLGLNDEACEADSERCAAIQALIEGDATQTEILWFQTHANFEDYLDIQKFFSEFSSPVLDSAPAYMAADLGFPYEKGLAFVETLYQQNGFAAVDDAYRNPPVSTEQILHPEKYPEDTPSAVSLSDLTTVLGENWFLADQNVMGEWYTFLILNKSFDESYRLSEDVAADAAEGWGGDSYTFYRNESTDEVVFVMDTIWDTVDDAEAFAAALEDYADLRWGESDFSIDGLPVWSGENQFSVLKLEGNRTLWVIAPQGELLSTILDQFR